MQAIIPSLWFDTQAEEAANFYVSIFPNSRITRITRYSSAGPREAGLVLTVDFELNGSPVNAINGGPDFKFSEATSLIVMCDSQAEIDELWEKLCAGGEPGPCGWLKDRYGFSWQIVPAEFIAMLIGGDTDGAQRAMAAMLRMSKIELDPLRAAYRGE